MDVEFKIVVSRDKLFTYEELSKMAFPINTACTELENYGACVSYRVYVDGKLIITSEG